MKRALLFAGQGAQAVGMGKDLFENSPAARAIYERADRVLGLPLSRYSFEGPDEELTKTSVCQPALYVHGLALLEALRENAGGLAFAGAAGLSLGEFTAHAAAGTFDFETGLRLVAARGRLMQAACEATQGGMVSLIGATPEQARRLAAETGVDAANFNCPGQVVLSGAAERIPAVIEAAKALGLRKAIPLRVAGAYHSQLMKSAQDGLRPLLAEAAFTPPAVPVLANVSGTAVREPERIREALALQVCGSVLWEDCVRALIADGVEQLVELGPGSVLAGMCRRIDPAIPCVSIGTWSELKEKAHELGK